MSIYYFRQLVKSALFFLFLNHSAYAAMQAVGVVKFSRGVVAAQQAGENLRLLGKGADIFLLDNIQTSEKSFVIIRFTDGGRITIRPESSLSITQYMNEKNNQQATFDLHKGGMRVSTGSIAQASDNYKIQTKQVTIKAQQADYSVRLCQQDCMQENTAVHSQKKKPKTHSVVARIVKLQGHVIAEDLNQNIRKLSVGAPLYSSDRVISKANSFALFVFRDASRMTLQANSELDIQHYQYQKESQPNQAIYKLITGGLRVLTGKIGKENKQDYQINTPVATIGIRGTGFDLFCAGEGCRYKKRKNCTDEACRQQKLDTKTPVAGLHSYVWDSTITQKNKKGFFELSAPQANYISSKNSQPQQYMTLPYFFKNNVTPRPDKEKVDVRRLFKTTRLKGTPRGTYVTVHEGVIQLVKTVLDDSNRSKTAQLKKLTHLGRNEVAYINSQGKVNRLEQRQTFQSNDPYLLSGNKNSEQLEVGLYSLLREQYSLPRSRGNLSASCTIETY